MGRFCIFVVIASCLCAGVAYAEGLGTLIEAGKNFGETAKHAETETAAYEQVKQAVETGALAAGASRDAVFASYGEPVVMNVHNASGREKWVYMPADSDHFKGEKICLYFRGETLEEIEERE